MPPSKPNENLAQAPFDDAHADVILRSSDQVHFRVYKPILSLASPVFADTFSIPAPPSESPGDEVQVVTLTEDATALEVALRHIYPVQTTPPEVEKLRYASILAEFARKYQVESLNRFITGYLTDSIEFDPVGVYAIAVAYEYKDIGANAARSCLNLPFSSLQNPYLRCAAAEHILELVRYHVACAEAASALASSDLTWFSSLGQNKIIGHITSQRGAYWHCNSCSTASIPQSSTSPEGNGTRSLMRSFGPRCLWNYLYRSALVLAHHPSADAVTTEAFVLQTNDCSSCVQDMRVHILEISVVLGREIRNTVKQVSLSQYPLSRSCDVQWYIQVPLPKGVSVDLVEPTSAAPITN
jgi:BTB/POZ domain